MKPQYNEYAQYPQVYIYVAMYIFGFQTTECISLVLQCSDILKVKESHYSGHNSCF